MKTWYVGHNKAYKKRKADGYEGWNTISDGYDEAKIKLDRIFGYGRAPDMRLGCRALHLSPGGEWWALSAHTRTNTDSHRCSKYR